MKSRKEYNDEYYKKNKEKIRLRRKEYNQRPDVIENKRLYNKTPRMVEAHKKWRENNREYMSNYMKEYNKIPGVREKSLKYKREYHFNFKKSVIDYYTKNNITCQCEKCNETGYSVLTVDHINGGGITHRKKLKATTIYKWLVDEGFPEGFQILCFNCNCTKGHNSENLCYHYQ